MRTEQHDGWQLETGTIRVELLDLGDGINGDFDPTDADDEPVLSLSVSQKDEGGQWRVVDDAFCRTRLSVSAPVEMRQQALETAMEQIEEFGRPIPTDAAPTTPPRKKSQLGM